MSADRNTIDIAGDSHGIVIQDSTITINSPEAAKLRRIQDDQPTRNYQIEVAKKAGLTQNMELLGISCVLIPSGIAGDPAVSNGTPYYLAETPISEASWDEIMDAGTSNKSDNQVKRGISFSDIKRFLENANDKLRNHDVACHFSLPSFGQMEFAIALAGRAPEEIDADAPPRLKAGQESYIGLYDLIGSVWQFCVKDQRSIHLVGGSYKTTVAPWQSTRAESMKCPSSAMRSEEFGFRPALTQSI